MDVISLDDMNEMRSFAYLLEFLRYYSIYLCHVENDVVNRQENFSKIENEDFVLHNFGTIDNPKEKKIGKSLTA